MSELSTPLTPDQQFAMHVYNAGEGVGGGARILQPDIDADIDPTPNEVYERALGRVGALFNRNFSAELPDVVQRATINVDPTTASGLGIETDGQQIRVEANISNIDLFSRIGFREAPNGVTKIVRGGTFYLRDINFSHEDIVDGHPQVTHKRLLNAGFRKNPLAERLNESDLAYEQAMVKESDAYLEGIEEIISSEQQSGEMYFVQPNDAFSEPNEAVRDALIRRLADKYNVPNLDEQLVASEVHFPNNDGQSLAITVSEARILGIQATDPTADHVAVPGIWRGITIHAVDTDHDITLTEVEIPVTLADGTVEYRRKIRTIVKPRVNAE